MDRSIIADYNEVVVRTHQPKPPSADLGYKSVDTHFTLDINYLPPNDAAITSRLALEHLR